MKISYSAVQSWRQCQQLYSYRYIDNLEPRMGEPAPELGRILHNYLEGYYRLYPTNGAAEAHADAINNVRAEFGPSTLALGNAAFAAGAEQLAADLFALVDRGVEMAERYYLARGIEDANNHVPLFVEHELEVPLTDTIITPTRIDLVTRDMDGLVWLWEHKSNKETPPTSRRLRDLQTVLYAAILEQQTGIKVDGVIWNYLRTKPPTVPEVLKNGTLTRRKDLDSTWPVFLAEIVALKQDPMMYDDVRLRLEGREREAYFVRMAQPIYQREDVLLRDFITSARAIETVRNMAQQGQDFTPVRTLAQHCEWCPMNKLCDAAIIGGDDSDLKQRLFKPRKEELVGASTISSTGPSGWGGSDEYD